MDHQDNPWNPSDEPVALDPATGALTLVDGTTFCLSARSGDFDGGVHGLFFADLRALSVLRLSVDGRHRCRPWPPRRPKGPSGRPSCCARSCRRRRRASG